MAEQASFVAGLNIPQNSDDAATLLQLARADGYDFVTTSLPHLPETGTPPSALLHPNPSGVGGGGAARRKDVTALESKWWSTSIVGSVVDPPGLVAPATAASPVDATMTESGAEPAPTEEGKEPAAAAATAAAVPVPPVAAAPPDPAAAAKDGLSLLRTLTSHSSPDQRDAERLLKSSVEWAAHMGIPAIVLPPVPLSSSSSSASASPAHGAHGAGAAASYARVLSTLALTCSATNVQLWVRTPLSSASLAAFDLLHRRCDNASNLGMLLCFDSTALSTNAPTTTNAVGEAMTLVHMAVGRNLKAVSFGTSVFLTNKRGYPTLSKSHQMLFTELLRRLGRTLRILVEGPSLHHLSTPDASGATGCLAYLQYLRHLRSRSEVTGVLDTEESSMEASYLDHLQSPLQPLGDNLEFQTYETFEKDPVKYGRYKAAIELALRDGVTTGRYGVGGGGANRMDGGLEVRIMVVGAGRGPLIRAALAAVDEVNVGIATAGGAGAAAAPTKIVPRIVGIEKNPSAALYLHSLLSREPSWQNGVVTIIQSDMRHATESAHPIFAEMKNDNSSRVDVLVSELLGSFGDNELSPECLDGVWECGLMKEGCVCIPQRYTAFLAPVSSMRLHSEARAQSYSPSSPTDGPGGQPAGMLRAMETPYVVRSHAACQTHVEKPCWEFVHPKLPPPNPSKKNGGTSSLSDNERAAHLLFRPDHTHGAGSGCGYGRFESAVASLAQSADPASSPPSSTTVHGFLGTFHSTLYQSPFGDKPSADISIAPATFSRGMFSWFPLYFPLREPIHVPGGSSLSCSFWRKVETDEDGGGGGGGGKGGGRVWYEWCAEVVSPDAAGADADGGGGAGVGLEGPDAVTAATPVHNPNGRSYYVRL